ncbi:hypothetical protein FSARC_13141 [Fusarium sarcochroum]|uniref:Uncharacterized protein n=1 Tax=Fusarium sarcochroum TaxID=1208366 RepID=A0A8H4T3J4_9HYPO|nr:hypothetical protein FSARC_13141 [Fusarium sarcochroum]
MAAEYYKYDPSLPAAVIFFVAFFISGLFHAWQVAKLKSWYFIPFVVGCAVEAFGCVGRAINANEGAGGWTKGPFIIQSMLLLLGPPFYAASIYMVLGRLIQLLEAGRYSMVRLSWLTKIFLFGDVASIVVQGIGGGILSGAEDAAGRDRGEAIIIAGLWIQLIFFGFFIFVTIMFHRRIHRKPTPASLKVQTPWKTLLTVLYLSSGLIMGRSIFRVIEYVMGKDGPLMSNEAYLYVFDVLLMLAVTVSFNIVHPSAIINKQSMYHMQRNQNSDSDIQLETHNPILNA